MSDCPIILRDATPPDMRLVWDSWSKGYVAAVSRGRRTHAIERLLLRRGMLDLAREIIARPGVRVIVAAYREVPSVLCGWACTESDTLHWVYVLRDYRRAGVGSYLVSGCKRFTLMAPTVADVPALRAMTWEPDRLLGG